MSGREGVYGSKAVGGPPKSGAFMIERPVAIASTPPSASRRWSRRAGARSRAGRAGALLLRGLLRRLGRLRRRERALVRELAEVGVAVLVVPLRRSVGVVGRVRLALRRARHPREGH